MNSWGLFVMITMIMVTVVGERESSKGLQNCDHSTHTTSWKTLLNNGIAYTPQMGYCFLSLSLSFPVFLSFFFEYTTLVSKFYFRSLLILESSQNNSTNINSKETSLLLLNSNTQ